MIRHDAALELAAVALDFDLTADEHRALDSHLSTCATCTRTVRGLHADASGLAALPVAALAPARADAIAARVLAPARPYAVRPLRLALVAALVALLALGSFLVGSELLRRADSDDDLSVVPPVPSASVAPDASVVADSGIGLQWSRVHDPDLDDWADQNSTMTGVIAGGPGAIAWGSVYGTGPHIWTTADGQEWIPADVEQVTDADPDQRQLGEVTDVAAAGPGYVAVGLYFRQGEGNTSLVWTSADGRTWQRAPDQPSFQASSMHRVIAWQGGLLAYGCSGGYDLECSEARAWSSKDGQDWTRIELQVPGGTFPSGQNYELRPSFDVEPAGNLLWMQASYSQDLPEITEDDGPVWLVSTDGYRWHRTDLPVIGPIHDAGQGRLAAAQGVTVYRSDDQRTWRQISIGLTTVGEDLLEVGGVLIMVGDDSGPAADCTPDCRAMGWPMGWRSIDGGHTWQAVPADEKGGTMTRVAAIGDGTLVAVGRRLDDAGSPSLAAWVSQPLRAPAASATPVASVEAPTPSPTELTWDTGQILAAGLEPPPDDIGVATSILGPDGVRAGLLPFDAAAPWAAWSPDGSRLVVLPTRGNDLVIWDVAADKSIASISGAYAPSWSPDGQHIAWCKGEIANPGDPCREVWLSGPSGELPTRLGSGWHGPLAWSPDGRWLLGRTLGTGTPEPFQLIDAATGSARSLGQEGACYDDPSWAAGDEAAGIPLRVIAIRDPACSGAFPVQNVIVSLDTETGAETRLTDGATANGALDVSPDGRWIALDRAADGIPGASQVVVMAADGTGQRVLTQAPPQHDIGVSWSSDGRWLLAMRSSHESDTQETPLGLVVIDPQGRGSTLIPGTKGATDWAWRPGPRP